ESQVQILHCPYADDKKTALEAHSRAVLLSRDFGEMVPDRALRPVTAWSKDPAPAPACRRPAPGPGAAARMTGTGPTSTLSCHRSASRTGTGATRRRCSRPGTPFRQSSMLGLPRLDASPVQR